jgi:hypothetical protein
VSHPRSIYSRDDHQFSPLHWAAKSGHTKIVEMLIARGAAILTTNMGDDTPLHLAAAHGHRDIVNIVRLTIWRSARPILIRHYPFQLIKNKADVNLVNEHGNTPLHYAAFWNYEDIAEDLVENGALVNIQNKYGETPLDKCAPGIAKRLYGENYSIDLNGSFSVMGCLFKNERRIWGKISRRENSKIKAGSGSKRDRETRRCPDTKASTSTSSTCTRRSQPLQQVGLSESFEVDDIPEILFQARRGEANGKETRLLPRF